MLPLPVFSAQGLVEACWHISVQGDTFQQQADFLGFLLDFPVNQIISSY